MIPLKEVPSIVKFIETKCRMELFSHILPFQITTPNTHLLPPKVTEEPGLLSRDSCPKTGRVLSHPVLPLPESSASSANCLPAPSLTPPQTCRNRGLLSPKSTPIHTEQFTALLTLSFHPYKANSGRRKVHDSYNLW